MLPIDTYSPNLVSFDERVPATPHGIMHQCFTDALVVSMDCGGVGIGGSIPTCKSSDNSPFPQIGTIGAMVIVWRVRGKIIRSVLCNIVLLWPGFPPHVQMSSLRFSCYRQHCAQRNAPVFKLLKGGL